MSFTAYFSYQANLRPAWKTFYISYPELKNALHHIRDELTTMKKEQKEHRKQERLQHSGEQQQHQESTSLLSYDNLNNHTTTNNAQTSSNNNNNTTTSIENFGLTLRKAYSDQETNSFGYQQAAAATSYNSEPILQESITPIEGVDTSNNTEGKTGGIVDDYFFRLEIGESLNMLIENFKNMF